MKNSLQLSSTEETMLQEIFNVVSKYRGKTRIFGVQLMHSHFPLKSGEVLYETHDKKARTLQVQPVKRSHFKQAPLATAWHQTKKGEIKVSMFCCEGSLPPPPTRH
jgi:hypothetical protein